MECSETSQARHEEQLDILASRAEDRPMPPSAPPHTHLSTRGMLWASIAYTAWGFFPLFWQLLKSLSPYEVVAHRVIWSLVFYAGLVQARGQWPQVQNFLLRARDPRLLLASALIFANWLLYIWAVTHGHVLESSLGYFITPLVSTVLGAWVLRERLAALQKIAFVMATIGVLLMAWNVGRAPWVALGLAATFSLYGLVRKVLPGEPMAMSFLETLVSLPAALVMAVIWRMDSTVALTPTLGLWLVLGGVVTGFPLLMFALAAKELPLTVLSFFQYLAPTFQFISAVFIFHESMQGRLHGFVWIWLALAVFSAHLWRAHRESQQRRRA